MPLDADRASPSANSVVDDHATERVTADHLPHREHGFGNPPGEPALPLVGQFGDVAVDDAAVRRIRHEHHGIRQHVERGVVCDDVAVVEDRQRLGMRERLLPRRKLLCGRKMVANFSADRTIERECLLARHGESSSSARSYPRRAKVRCTKQAVITEL
jgi:hypothetical protein